MAVITQGLIGASLVNVVETPADMTPGDFDPFAPFALGSMGFTTPVEDTGGFGGDAQFARIGVDGVLADGVVGIVDGISEAATETNSWVNKTGVDLVEGNYAWLVSAPATVDLTPPPPPGP
jgi:hypothetical protein